MTSNIESRSRNCLNFIRLFAAAQVMIKHLVVHLSAPINGSAYTALSFFGGVPIFFAISGLLIWFSVERTDSFGDYCKKRFFRIYPELWVGVLIEIATILIFYRGWNPLSLIVFAFTQGSFLQFWTPDSLNGYGCGAPNGALWTIGITIQFYLAVWFIYKLLHSRRTWIWLVGFVGTVALSLFGNAALEIIGIDVLVKLYSQTLFRYLWLFYIGCFIAEFFDKIIEFISRFWFVFLFAAIIPFLSGFGLWLGNYNLLWALPLCVGVIGFSYRFPKISLKTDISYGIFIYHMIVANVFITLGWVGNWWYVLAVSAISCVLACLSYILTKNLRVSPKKKL